MTEKIIKMKQRDKVAGFGSLPHPQTSFSDFSCWSSFVARI